jgi:hypothetical protein
LKRAVAGASSPTQALSDAYAQREVELRSLHGSLKRPATAVGVAVFYVEKFKG